MPTPRCLVEPAERRVLLLGAAAVVVAELERLRERALVIAAVVDEPGHRRVRELRRLHHVATTDLGRVDADLGGERIHRPLDRVRRLGTTGAAIRVGGRHSREDRRAAERVVRHVVDARIEEGAEQRDARRDELQVRAHVADDVDAHRGDLAVRVRREVDLLDLAAALDRRLRALGALLDPTHWKAVLAGECHGEQLLGVDVQLRAEPAADGRRDRRAPGARGWPASTRTMILRMWGICVAE